MASIIDVQLHTLAPQKLTYLKKELEPAKLDAIKLRVAAVLQSLTVERFETGTDPWGNPWIPSQRVVNQGQLIDEFAAAKAAYPEKRKRYRAAKKAYDKRYAKWVSDGMKGKAPEAPEEPKRPVQPTVRSSKLTKAGQTLVLSTRLRDSFEVAKKGDTVVLTQVKKEATAEFGGAGAISNLVYFPTHQWGLPKKKVPARPMLPIRGNVIDLPESYRKDISARVKDWVKKLVA
ncbi:MAG: hypothetical protein LBR80_06955 [Deltaproteobacteria bacterium]|jgi:phage gpG-like protein|nr:hypothetical protein [Deltaproteobacteria bacterium]